MTFCSQLEYKRTEDRRSNSHGGVALTPLHRIAFCSASGSEHPQNDPSSNSTKKSCFAVATHEKRQLIRFLVQNDVEFSYKLSS